MRDKSVGEMAGILFPVATRVIVTAPQQARAVQPSTVRDAIDHDDLVLAPDVAAALQMAAHGPPDGVVVVTGSLFLVAEARALMLLSS
jgi:dihydrofolate synthase/folylpolyglutamate synthase